MRETCGFAVFLCFVRMGFRSGYVLRTNMRDFRTNPSHFRTYMHHYRTILIKIAQLTVTFAHITLLSADFPHRKRQSDTALPFLL